MQFKSTGHSEEEGSGLKFQAWKHPGGELDHDPDLQIPTAEWEDVASLTGLGLDSGACSLLTVLHGTSCFMSLTLSFPIGGLGSFCVYFHVC